MTKIDSKLAEITAIKDRCSAILTNMKTTQDTLTLSLSVVETNTYVVTHKTSVSDIYQKAQECKDAMHLSVRKQILLT